MIIRSKTRGASSLRRSIDKVKAIRNLASLTALGLLFLILATGCSSTSMSGDSSSASATSSKKPLYYEVKHDGRYYVMGDAMTYVKFKEQPHLPYTQTHIGMGPRGETVVVEVDKKNPAYADHLWKEFKDRHLFYAEEQHDGRIYVIGIDNTHTDFLQQPHLPYTRTKIGYGPHGETVVFEVDKKNPAMVERLEREFNDRNRFYAEEQHNGRLYIIGQEDMHKSFQQQQHLPYTHTRIGAGPNRETLVFQVDKKNPAMLNRLKSQFSERHDMTLD